MSLQDFLANVEEGNLSELELYNYVETATNNFKLEKLELLLKGIEFYIFQRREEFYAENEAKLDEILYQYYITGKEVPYKDITDPNTLKGKGQLDTIRVVDKDKLFSNAIHYQLFSIYELKKFVVAGLRNNDVAKSTNNETKEEELLDYLTEEGKRAMPALLHLYNRVKKKEYALLYIALQELELLTERIRVLGEAKIVSLLTTTFGPQVGGRGNFNRYLNDYRHPDSVMRAEIEHHKQRILDTLKL
ncbi:hypothetical protein [Pontibacter flavimaris]|uniref:Uncharacterized protein n=1 Tax=Pontibacter flavimaris TaxID=1797110 RepID=A0A1Q5PBC7_9BACT|nr:hypothetical protein [Pontibacter flavimaris]OKL39535.1 hypothetical protein A3841_00870 [Pontibacter flavimaris]